MLVEWLGEYMYVSSRINHMHRHKVILYNLLDQEQIDSAYWGKDLSL